MTKNLRRTGQLLGGYAALLGLEHGAFELLQGSRPREALLIQAIGPPCQPAEVWHACFPAMSLLPTLRAAGLVTAFVSIVLLYWAAFRAGIRGSYWVVVGLSVALMLSGGGFVPVWIALLSSLALYWDSHFPGWLRSMSNIALPGSKIWRLLAVVLLVWFPLSWLLGFVYNDLMLQLGGFLFFVFDLMLPALLLFAGAKAAQAAQTEPAGVTDQEL